MSQKIIFDESTEKCNEAICDVNGTSEKSGEAVDAGSPEKKGGTDVEKSDETNKSEKKRG